MGVEIFILEDQKGEAAALKIEILDRGGSPTICRSLKEAIETVEQRNRKPFFAYFLDINVPKEENDETEEDMGGSVYHLLVEDFGSISNCYLISAYVTKHDVELAKKLGIPVIQKGSELTDKFNELLGTP